MMLFNKRKKKLHEICAKLVMLKDNVAFSRAKVDTDRKAPTIEFAWRTEQTYSYILDKLKEIEEDLNNVV